jgi:hypothetical protein
MDSLARAGIPTEWEEWPPLLRAFGIIGLELEIVENMKTLPSAPAKGNRVLTPIDYVQLLSWRNIREPPTRRWGKQYVLRETYLLELAKRFPNFLAISIGSIILFMYILTALATISNIHG